MKEKDNRIKIIEESKEREFKNDKKDLKKKISKIFNRKSIQCWNRTRIERKWNSKTRCTYYYYKLMEEGKIMISLFFITNNIEFNEFHNKKLYFLQVNLLYFNFIDRKW